MSIFFPSIHSGSVDGRIHIIGNNEGCDDGCSIFGSRAAGVFDYVIDRNLGTVQLHRVDRRTDEPDSITFIERSDCEIFNEKNFICSTPTLFSVRDGILDLEQADKLESVPRYKYRLVIFVS